MYNNSFSSPTLEDNLFYETLIESELNLNPSSNRGSHQLSPSVAQHRPQPPQRPNQQQYSEVPQLTYSPRVLNFNSDKYQLLFLNKKSKNNQANNNKLFNYFDKNLEKLNAHNLSFEWDIAQMSEKDLYLEQNIKSFPVLIPPMSNHNQYKIGAENIIRYLNNCIKQVKNNNIQIKKNNQMGRNENGDFDIKNYLSNEINGNNNEDFDENDDFSQNLTSRIAQFQQQREVVGGQHSTPLNQGEQTTRNAQAAARNLNFDIPRPLQDPNNLTSFVRQDNLNASGGREGNLDDLMMESYFSNLEETPTR